MIRATTKTAKPAGEKSPVKAVPKVPVTIRLDADVVEHWKATGKGWQTRLNAALRKLL